MYTAVEFSNHTIIITIRIKHMTILLLAADLLLRSLHGQENGIRGKTKGSHLDFYHYFYDGEVKTYQPDLSKELRSHFGFSEFYFRQCMNIRELECT